MRAHYPAVGRKISSVDLPARVVGTLIADGTEHLRVSRRLPPRASGKSRRNSRRSGFSAAGLEAPSQTSDAPHPGYRVRRLAARPSAGGRWIRGRRHRPLAHDDRGGAPQSARTRESSLLPQADREVHSPRARLRRRNLHVRNLSGDCRERRPAFASQIGRSRAQARRFVLHRYRSAGSDAARDAAHDVARAHRAAPPESRSAFANFIVRSRGIRRCIRSTNSNARSIFRPAR